MGTRRYRLLALMLLLLGPATVPPTVPAQTSARSGGRPAPPEVVAALQRSIEQARQRLEARDANGVLAHVSEQYRSQGLTKTEISQHLYALCALYEQLRVRVSIDQARMVDGVVWVYTTGEVSGRLPFVGWTPALSWKNQPEVARNEGSSWRLF